MCYSLLIGLYAAHFVVYVKNLSVARYSTHDNVIQKQQLSVKIDGSRAANNETYALLKLCVYYNVHTSKPYFTRFLKYIHRIRVCVFFVGVKLQPINLS